MIGHGLNLLGGPVAFELNASVSPPEITVGIVRSDFADVYLGVSSRVDVTLGVSSSADVTLGTKGEG